MKSRNYFQSETFLPSVSTYEPFQSAGNTWLRQDSKARDQVYQARLNDAFVPPTLSYPGKPVPPSGLPALALYLWPRCFFSKKESCTSDLSGIRPSSPRGGF